MKILSNVLKLCLFATGLSGIVPEYILSTLATYFLGDSVLQWTMIVSIMLFSMGLGSRLSKYFNTNLIEKFIYIEFILSFLVAFSSLFAYLAASYTNYSGFVIYSLSIVIGILIGMEIPLVVRLNDEFETLRVNVATVIEKDYYGSLVGGVFFAFFGLPYLGLTFTPFVLGFINFSVAILLYLMLQGNLLKKVNYYIRTSAISLLVLLILGIIFAKPIILYGEQRKYHDWIIYSEQSRYQKIVITQWKDDYWLYINGNQQLCTLDEVMYHEPLVHPAMKLAINPTDVLIIGGGDGCAAREVLKYPMVKKIVLVDLDPAMTELGKKNEILVNLNKGALNNSKVEIINTDGFNYIQESKGYFDVIIIDLPDPKSIELSRLFSVEFYTYCNKILRNNGVIVTQAVSPYFATRAYLCIEKSVKGAGFNTLLLHNQIVTMGEWGWVIGMKTLNSEQMKSAALSLRFDNIETKWINNEAMYLMTSFGKNFYPNFNIADSIEENTIHNPVLHRYYLKGNWDLY